MYGLWPRFYVEVVSEMSLTFEVWAPVLIHRQWQEIFVSIVVVTLFLTGLKANVYIFKTGMFR